ncbi:MAG: DUF2974 domain-containing protein [Lachnospiraceae bacterium]|nr:DUF2974 domain-containing protein [Lachnospiraceae bacterium]
MANIIDYVSWRGDFTFEERPMNKVDNLIFCHLSYLDMTELFMAQESYTIAEIWEHLGDRAEFRILSSDGKDRELLEACAKSKRFADILVTDYEDNTEVRENKQFAAVTFHINEENAYIVYRGTDDTIVGWKEDFMLSYCKVPAQKQALDYAKRMIAKNKFCYIGGHSKGGNLALYASAFLEKEEFSKVKRVFLNDSPGFCPDVLDTSRIQAINHKCIRTTPEFCIVGAIFEPEITKSYIVKSDATQMMQHSMLSWQIKGVEFEEVEDHDVYADALNGLLDKFIEKMDNLEDRQAFVNSIFDTMAEDGAVTIEDFTKKGPAAIENVLVSVLGENAEGLNPLKSVRENVTGDFKNSPLWKFWDEKSDGKTILRIAGSILVGILCYKIPENLIEVVFAILIFGAVAYQLGLTGYHLIKSKFNFYKERLRVNISIILIVIHAILIVKDHALFLVSSIILGIFFIMSSYHCALRVHSCGENKLAKARYIFETVLSFIFGGYLIVSSDVSLTWYTMSVGSYMFFDAIFEAIHLYRKRKGIIQE